jgi:hypothetical protein
MVTLSMRLLGSIQGHRLQDVTCTRCGFVEQHGNLLVMPLRPYNICHEVNSVQADVDACTGIVLQGDECIRTGVKVACTSCGGDMVFRSDIPELLVFQVWHRQAPEVTAGVGPFTINECLRVGEDREYRLVGMIYHGNYHFVSRIITPESHVFFHDGIHGAYSTREGELNVEIQAEELHHFQNKPASVAIYVLD